MQGAVGGLSNTCNYRKANHQTHKNTHKKTEDVEGDLYNKQNRRIITMKMLLLSPQEHK